MEEFQILGEQWVGGVWYRIVVPVDLPEERKKELTIKMASKGLEVEGHIYVPETEKQEIELGTFRRVGSTSK